MKKLFLSEVFRLGRASLIRAEKGAVLFLTVTALCILSILAVGAARNVLQEQKMARRVTEDNVSYYAARSVAHALTVIFASKETPGAISLHDLRHRDLKVGHVVVRVRFYDEQSRLDIFGPPREEELKHLPGLKHKPELVRAISRSPREYSFVKEDLLLFKGMTPEIYDQFKDWVTARGFIGGVNINTASAEMLEVVGVPPGVIDLILNLRSHTPPENMVKKLEASIVSDSDRAVLGLLLGFNKIGVISRCIGMDMEVMKRDKKLHSYHILSLTVPPKFGSIFSWNED